MRMRREWHMRRAEGGACAGHKTTRVAKAAACYRVRGGKESGGSCFSPSQNRGDRGGEYNRPGVACGQV